MFIGHDAVGFASKGLAPRTSLGWLIAAPMFADLLWPILLLTGTVLAWGAMATSLFPFWAAWFDRHREVHV